MKKILLILLSLICIQTFGQLPIKKYAERHHQNGTIDSFYVRVPGDSVFRYSDDVYAARTAEYYSQFCNPTIPGGFANYVKGADGIYRNISQLIDTLQDLVPLKANIASPTFTGTVAGVTKSMVGLANADNTADASKPISTAAQTALNNKSTVYFGIDAGASDSYVAPSSNAPGAYFTGMVLIIKANTVNTGAASINFASLGVKTIVKRVNTVLANGDIPSLSLAWLVYDGTNFVLLNPVVN